MLKLRHLMAAAMLMMAGIAMAQGAMPIPVSLGQYYWPYHGKSAAAGKSASDVARDLGWDTSVWDLSGSEPVLK